MSNWKNTLNISDIWNSDLPIEKKGKKIASMIKHQFSQKLDLHHDDFDCDLDDIVYAMENITGYDNVSSIEEFDEWMSALYDWADQEISPTGQWPPNKMCWIQTAQSPFDQKREDGPIDWTIDDLLRYIAGLEKEVDRTKTLIRMLNRVS